MSIQQIKKSQITRCFNRAASTYDEVAIIQRCTTKEILRRLEMIKLSPTYILDVGCGTGYGMQLLEKQYPAATVIGLDISPVMLRQAYAKKRWWKKRALVLADAFEIPIRDASIDLIYANFLLPFCDDLATLLSTWYRLLKPGGLLMFTTLGPDTFKELRHSWAEVDNNMHVQSFLDMHDIGDLLLETQFLDPVIDISFFTLTYPTIAAMVKDFKQQGIHNFDAHRINHLCGKKRFQHFSQAYAKYKNANNALPLTCEVIYGHAWRLKHESAVTHKSEVITISANKIGRIINK